MKKTLGFLVGLSLLVPGLAFASVGITLSGGSVTISQGTSYNEPGYSALSTTDGDVTSLVSVSGISAAVGSHTITYSVTDSALDSATAFRTLTVQGGGSVMPFCSGPMAPGWQIGVAGGGCGGTEVWVPAGSAGCPFWFVGGCVVKE